MLDTQLSEECVDRFFYLMYLLFLSVFGFASRFICVLLSHVPIDNTGLSFEPYACSLSGLEMSWVSRPPERVISGLEFNVIYSVTASVEFYQWAIDNMIFTKRYCMHASYRHTKLSDPTIFMHIILLNYIMQIQYKNRYHF